MGWWGRAGRLLHTPSGRWASLRRRRRAGTWRGQKPALPAGGVGKAGKAMQAEAQSTTLPPRLRSEGRWCDGR